MEAVKKVAVSLKNNWIGAIAGGVSAYFIAKKKLNVSNKFGLAGIAVVGAVIGSAIEYKVKAKFVKPAIAAAKK